MSKIASNKILFLLLVAAMVFAMMPLTAAAVDDTAIIVAAFDELDDFTLYQGYDFDTVTLDELILPNTLTGTDADGEPIAINGVTWQSEPDFDPAKEVDFPGYIFAPVLPEGYALAEGVTAPVITVFIRPQGGVEKEPTAVTGITIGSTSLSAGGSEVTGATWSGSTLTLAAGTYGAIDIACATTADIATIEVTGAVTVTSTTAAAAIYCNANLIISGTGSLTANGNNTTGSQAINVYSDITINAATTANGGNDNSDSGGYGINANAITINAATIAKGGNGTTGGQGISPSGVLNINSTTMATGGTSSAGSGGNGIHANGAVNIKALTTATGGTGSSGGSQGLYSSSAITFADANATLTAQDGASASGNYSVTKDFTGHTSYAWLLNSDYKGTTTPLSVGRSATQYTISLTSSIIPTPTITSISPTFGPPAGGTSVTLTGTNLSGATAVTVGGTAATGLTVNSDTQITFVTPVGSAGAKNVVVTTPGGTATLTNGFTYGTDITNDFTDLNFRAAVRNYLQMAPTDPIYGMDVADMTSLYVQSSNITNLAGIEHFTSLEMLYCGNNQLTSLPDNLPSGLTSLDCSNNWLTALPTLPTGLITLECYVNELTSLPALPGSLKELDCIGNQLTVLPTLHNTLEVLYCGENPLTTFPLTLPTDLKELSCGGNGLTALPVNLPTGLKALKCDDNSLTTLPTLPDTLEELYCSNNLLTALPTLPATLEELYCVNNQLTGLDVTALNSLRYLDCSYNNMASESAVIGFTGTWGSGYDAFIFAPQLTTNITAGFTDANFLAAVRTALSKGASAPIYASDVVGVTTLNVAGENIASLAGIEHFIGLEALVCYGNQLTELPELPTGLTRLDCYRNQLTALPELPSGLKMLDCSNNRLTALPTLPIGLITLNCYNNQLTTLPATLPNSLEYLNCSYNRLTSLNLTGLNNLTFSDGQNQERSLTMTGSGGSYTANVTMNAGATFGNSALSYANGVLTSTSNTATTSTFTAPTGLGVWELSGTLTLTYPGVTPPAPTTYTVTVVSGTGGGSYAAGATVSIIANAAPSGQTFDKWTTTSSGVTFANANSASTTFVMPANSVSVTATYKSTGGGGIGGGGGGIGGGGGGTPTQTAPAADGAVKVEYSQSGGAVTLALPESKLNEIIGESKNTATLDLSGIKNATSAALPKAALDKLAEAGLDVALKLPQGTLTLDANAAASVAKQAGTNVSVELKQLKVSDLPQEQRQAVRGSDIIVDINLYSGNSKISNINGTLSVTVPYNGPLPAAVWYLNEAGELEPMSCSYDPVTKTVTFTTDHLSLYVIGQATAEPAATAAPAWANPFTDISEANWFYADVAYVTQNGLMNGTGATLFSPNAPLTRAMMATVLYRMEGAPEVEPMYAAHMMDVAEGAWYEDAMGWAAKNGILSGYGEGLYGPNDNITRQQLVTMLYRYIQYTGGGFEGAWMFLLEYADREDIAEWAYEAACYCTVNSIIGGKPGNLFDPSGTATRAEAAAMLHRLMEQ